MKRRSFVKAAASLPLISAIPMVNFSCTSPKKYKLGYQLFSVHDRMQLDPKGTLEALKAMGYEDFEIYGFNGSDLSYYGIKAKEFRSILDDYNLSVTSGHYGFSEFLFKTEEELMRYTDQCIEGAHALNSPYITWPWTDPKFRNTEGYKKISALLNQIGEHVNKAGLGLAYHNHGYEFEAENGIMGYEILTEETDAELVKLQMDMYWVMHAAKTTPKALVERFPGRIVMWHIKDMHKVSRDYTELGNGSIDYHSILPDPKSSGLEYFFIEQGGNFSVDSMTSAASSAEYFKKELSGYL